MKESERAPGDRAGDELGEPVADQAPFSTLAVGFSRLDAAARADSTVGTPREVGARTVVPLAEVWYGGGFGLGGGRTPNTAESGGGGGGGFGGRVRPVAVVEVGPDGTRVKPVLDFTMLGLALAGLALGAIIRRPWRRH